MLTFSVGFEVKPGLRIGDSGLPKVTDGSNRLDCSGLGGARLCSSSAGEGPVTRDMSASPNGPARQFVPGALLDLSWPKASVEFLRKGGRPGMVAVICQYAGHVDCSVILT